METSNCKISWGFQIQAGHKLIHKRVDVSTTGKVTSSCLLIDIVCPIDSSVDQWEKVNVAQYQDVK